MAQSSSSLLKEAESKRAAQTVTAGDTSALTQVDAMGNQTGVAQENAVPAVDTAVPAVDNEEKDDKSLGQKAIAALNNLTKLKLSNGETLDLLPGLGDSIASTLMATQQDYETSKDFLERQLGSGDVNVNTVNQTSVGGGGQGSINYQNASTQNDHQAWMEYLRRQGTIY